MSIWQSRERKIITHLLDIIYKKKRFSCPSELEVNIYDPDKTFDRSIDWAYLLMLSKFTFLEEVDNLCIQSLKKQKEHGILSERDNLYIQVLEASSGKGLITQTGAIMVSLSAHNQCKRCKKYLEEVGTLPLHDICTRCYEVVREWMDANEENEEAREFIEEKKREIREFFEKRDTESTLEGVRIKNESM